MYLHQHVAATDETAIYPEAGTGSLTALTYVALALAGEASEVLEKAATAPLDVPGLQAELGDVLWLLSRGHRELDIDPHAALAADISDLDQAAAGPAGQLVTAAGQIAGIVSKAHRDDNGLLSADRRAALAREFTRALAIWIDANRYWTLGPADTAEANLAKLRSRRDRGVLTGSGDYR